MESDLISAFRREVTGTRAVVAQLWGSPVAMRAALLFVWGWLWPDEAPGESMDTTSTCGDGSGINYVPPEAGRRSAAFTRDAARAEREMTNSSGAFPVYGKLAYLLNRIFAKKHSHALYFSSQYERYERPFVYGEHVFERYEEERLARVRQLRGPSGYGQGPWFYGRYTAMLKLFEADETPPDFVLYADQDAVFLRPDVSIEQFFEAEDRRGCEFLSC